MREEIPIAVVNTHLRACAQDRAIIDQAAMLADSIRRALIA
jgi:predicted anti-sigma-YlaC factor YlaD